MTTHEILEALDGQISRLQEARLLLASVEQGVRRNTSGTKSEALHAILQGSAPTPKRRTMSAEGRARIAAAQRERWAKRAATTSAADKPSVVAEPEPRKGSTSSPRKSTAKSPRKITAPPTKSTTKK